MTRNRLFPHLIAIIVLVLLWALFFWRVLTPNEVDRVVFPEGDFTQHYYAFSEYQVRRLVQGEFPLWNPYNHSGDPFAANIQFVAFYPPRLIAAAIVGEGWSILNYQHEVAVHYLLASLMMYAFLQVFLRDWATKDHKNPYTRSIIALTGSVLYAYSGYLTGYPMLQVSVLESVVWLPLIMSGVHLAAFRSGWLIWGCSIGGIGVALSLFGGHPQTTMQLTYFALLYLAFVIYQRRMNLLAFVLRAGLFGLIGAGLSMIQLLPAAEFTALSFRVTSLGFADKANGFVGADFLQVIWPHLFGVWSPLYLGVAGFLLAVGAMLRQKPLHRFLMVVIVVAAFLSFGGNTIVFDVFYNIVPGFSIFRQQERIASIMVFAIVLLATLQLHWLFAREEAEECRLERNFTWIVAGYVIFLIVIYIFGTIVTLLQDGAASDSPQSVTSVFGFVALVGIAFAGWIGWARGQREGQSRVALPLQIAPLILILVVDLFSVGTRSENYLPDVPENRVELLPALRELQVAPTDVRWRVDGAAGLQGNGVLFSVPDIYGTGPFSLASIEELRRIPVERFWEVLSVRYVTTLDEPPVDKVDLELLAYDANYTGDEFRLFEIVDPRPMAHLVYDVIVAEDNPPFAREIMADPRVNLRDTAVTTEILPFELPGERPELSSVDNYEVITPEHIEMTVSTSADALLTVSIVNYPGWRATLNGESVKIIDTYAGLISIPMRAGENQQVTLKFAPDSVRMGAIITGLTAIFVLVSSGWVFGMRQQRATVQD